MKRDKAQVVLISSNGYSSMTLNSHTKGTLLVKGGHGSARQHPVTQHPPLGSVGISDHGDMTSGVQCGQIRLAAAVTLNTHKFKQR